MHAARRRDLAKLRESRPCGAIEMINASHPRATWSVREFTDNIEIIRRGAPNARRAANVDSASFGKNSIRLATERLSGLVEFPYANAVRKMVVADRIPMKLPSAIANCPV